MSKFVYLIVFLISIATSVDAQDNNNPSYVAWSSNGTRIATAYYNTSMVISDASTGQEIQTLEGTPQYITSIAWSPDNTLLAGGSIDGIAYVWEVETGRLTYRLEGHNESPFVFWTPDGSRIFTFTTGTNGGPTLRIWSVQDGTLLKSVDLSFGGDTVWSPDGTRLVITTSSSIYIYDPNTLRFSIALIKNDIAEDQYFPTRISWSSDSKYLAVGYHNGNVRVWDINTESILHEFKANESASVRGTFPDMRTVLDVEFEADYILSAVSANGTVRTWDISTGEVVAEAQINEPILEAFYSPYEGRIAVAILDDTNVQRNKNVARLVDKGNVQIIVPNPSVDKLRRIAPVCLTDAENPSPDVQEVLSEKELEKLDKGKLPNFVDKVKKLKKGDIPEACAADLIAVAEAVIAEE